MRLTAILTLPVVFISLGCFTPFASAATAEQVQNAIDRGKEYIYSQMHGDNWEIVPAGDPKFGGAAIRGGQWGGLTALATYALLASGENPQDPRIVQAVEFLRKANLIGTYAIGLRAQVWPFVPKTDLVREATVTDAKLLLTARRTEGPNKGEYTYENSGSIGISDHSNSQYGVLGLWACSEVVEGIPEKFWTDADQSWRSEQGDDGSWAYTTKPGTKDGNGYPSIGNLTMTAAGLATLFITRDFLYRGRGLECTGDVVDNNIDAGLKWLGAHFTPELSAGGWSYYGLYGVERVGVASGYRYFGDIDWFARGADSIIKAQSPKDGGFPAGFDVNNVQATLPLIDTCFSLLFLSRGRAPVMMNKLEYRTANAEANWNERPRDAFNIAHWVGKQTETTLNWQIVTIKSPVDDWHDAPILYIAGDQALNFTPEETIKLRTFVEQGGLILANADCGRQSFSQSFLKLGSALFKNYKFKPLTATDTIMHDEQFNAVKWRRKPTVLAMDNGARKLMLLIPDADPARGWQMQQTSGKEELFQLAANIFLYAVDKQNMFVKGETYIVEPRPAVKVTNTIDVARLSYDGNWDPEPGGWRRLSAVMRNGDSIDVNAVALDPAKDALAGNKIAHLTGTDTFRLTAPAIAALQQFVRAGGTLVVDAAGGKTAFCASAQQMLGAVFGEDAAQLSDPLPASNPLYEAGGALEKVTYREYARRVLGSLKEPRLRGIIRNNRLACIYSPEDLSVGLVGEPVDGIMGYSPASATALMRKILLLASGEQPVSPALKNGGAGGN